MQAIIPYKLRSDTTELRYAIRSLVKYFTPLTNIIIVGNAPDWYVGDSVKFQDINRRKEFSIYSKLMAAGLREPVLYTNDDFFALKPFDETLPNYYWGLCGEKRPQNRMYRELYANCPKEWKNFDIHVPMIIDTSRFTNWPIDRPIKTQYANLNKLDGVALPDCKIRGCVSRDAVMEVIKDRPFFSTGDNAYRPGILQALNELYPEKSKYEKY